MTLLIFLALLLALDLVALGWGTTPATAVTGDPNNRAACRHGRRTDPRGRTRLHKLETDKFPAARSGPARPGPARQSVAAMQHSAGAEGGALAGGGRGLLPRHRWTLDGQVARLLEHAGPLGRLGAGVGAASPARSPDYLSGVVDRINRRCPALPRPGFSSRWRRSP
jgi:hypothetical protein